MANGALASLVKGTVTVEAPPQAACAACDRTLGRAVCDGGGAPRAHATTTWRSTSETQPCPPDDRRRNRRAQYVTERRCAPLKRSSGEVAERRTIQVPFCRRNTPISVMPSWS
jgi:hypothetical protein